MSNEEIHERIVRNNKMIEKLFKPDSFELNPKITELLIENADLQEHCEHKFENGFCVYCYAAEVINKI